MWSTYDTQLSISMASGDMTYGVRRDGTSRSSTYYSRDRLYFSKWVTFSSAAVLILSAGLPYAFTIYGVAIQEALGYSQKQTGILGSAANAGGYASLFSGLFYDWLKKYKRYGPRTVALVGAMMYVVGFFGMYAASIGLVNMPFWGVLVLVVIANNGGCWLETAGLITCVRNFETERGAVVGILKSFLGLSASLYTTIYMTFASPDPIKFLLLLAIVPAAVTLVAAPGLNYVPFVQVEPHTKSHAFHLSLTAIVSMAAYQMVSAMFYQHAAHEHRLPGHEVNLMLFVAVLGLLAPVLMLPMVFGGLRAVPLDTEQTFKTIAARSPAIPENEFGPTDCSATTPLLYDSDSTDTLECARRKEPMNGASSLARGYMPLTAFGSTLSTLSCIVDHPTVDHAADDRAGADDDAGADGGDENVHNTDRVSLSPAQCLASFDFWLLCAVFSITSGAGLALINNVGAIVGSLEGGAELRAVLVSLYSASSCLGRMTTGFLPERAFKEFGIPRPTFFLLSSILAAASSVMCAYATLDTLAMCGLVTGYVFGFIQGLAPTVVSEMFGLQHFASNNALVNTSLLAGSVGMAQYLMSAVYSSHAHESGGACIGPSCFRTGFLICAAMCLASVAGCVLLCVRTSSLYVKLRRSLLRERRKRGVTAVNRSKDLMLAQMDDRLQHASLDVDNAFKALYEMQQMCLHAPPFSQASSDLHFDIQNEGGEGQTPWIPDAATSSTLRPRQNPSLQRELSELEEALKSASLRLRGPNSVMRQAAIETESLASPRGSSRTNSYLL